jgi:hypothetical protein
MRMLTKTFFLPEPKTDTTYSTTGKKVPPAHVKQVYWNWKEFGGKGIAGLQFHCLQFRGIAIAGLICKLEELQF